MELVKNENELAFTNLSEQNKRAESNLDIASEKNIEYEEKL